MTQQFNTSTSMGRLTLNVLLSFAQFEREIIAERTRDKMGAARRKGMWTGGPPILGYDVHPEGGRIVVNEEEAARVREIFELYLAEESLGGAVRELNRRGWRTKSWTTRRGIRRPGRPFEKNLLLNLLRSRTYLGQVDYQGVVYPGQHAAIVATDTILAWHRRLIVARGSNPTDRRSMATRSVVRRIGWLGGTISQAFQERISEVLRGEPLQLVLQLHPFDLRRNPVAS